MLAREVTVIGNVKGAASKIFTEREEKQFHLIKKALVS